MSLAIKLLRRQRLENQALAIAAKYGAQVYLPGRENFSDSTLTTPAVNDGSVGGVVGQSIGPELITNGDFSNGTTGWSAVSSTLAVVGGELEVTGDGTTDRAKQDITYTAGKSYQVRASARPGTSGAQIISFFSAGYANNLTFSGVNGTVTGIFTPSVSGVGEIWLRCDTGTAYFDNISVKELGYIVSQATAGFKPLLVGGARNLLTYSEDLSNAVWVKNAATATASVITDSTGVGFHFIQNASLSLVSGITYTFRARLQKGTALFGGIHINDGTSRGCSIDLTTGVLGTPYGGATATVAADGDGWLLSITAVCGATTSVGGFAIYISTTNALATYTYTTPLSITATNLQIETGSTASPYIPTTSSAASSGANPKAWLFDGVDDRLSLSGPITSMSADHFVVVCAKPTALATMKIYHSGSVSDTPRSPSLGFNGSGFANVTWRDDALTLDSRDGSVSRVGSSVVLSAVKQGNNKRLRENSIQLGATLTSALGTTTLTMTDIGRNTASGSQFNGQIYGVIAGKGAITDAELLVLEKYLASRGGIQL